VEKITHYVDKERKTSLRLKIEQKKSKIGIVGLGYVGLPLALHFAKRGFEVLGFDIKGRFSE
jgi:UDP-N-acetyl-D-glucosamine dehydrogenase